MRKVTTNTLATLVLIGVVSLSSINTSAKSGFAAGDTSDRFKKLERLYQHHDRKHELRASVLGISAEELRQQLKDRSIDTVIKKHGFKNRISFYTAVTGKLKDELHRRGWSERKIEEYVQKRLARLPRHSPQSLAFSV